MADADGSAADLHSGVSSPAATFGNEEIQSETVKKEIAKQREQAQKLIPAAETVLEVIDEERRKVDSFSSFFSDTIKTNQGKVDDNALTIEARAREMHLGFLKQLETKVKDRLSTASRLAQRSKKSEPSR